MDQERVSATDGLGKFFLKKLIAKRSTGLKVEMLASNKSYRLLSIENGDVTKTGILLECLIDLFTNNHALLNSLRFDHHITDRFIDLLVSGTVGIVPGLSH